ncbi:MAG: hypothetical protein ABIT37_16295 [Luteolibacter sp.]
MEPETVNCGRCASLWNKEANRPGFGRCASHARQQQTGKIRPLVDLNATCEHAQLSAKFNPEYFPRLIAERQAAACYPPTGGGQCHPPTAPVETTAERACHVPTGVSETTNQTGFDF